MIEIIWRLFGIAFGLFCLCVMVWLLIKTVKYLFGKKNVNLKNNNRHGFE